MIVVQKWRIPRTAFFHESICGSPIAHASLAMTCWPTCTLTCHHLAPIHDVGARRSCEARRSNRLVFACH